MNRMLEEGKTQTSSLQYRLMNLENLLGVEINNIKKGINNLDKKDTMQELEEARKELRELQKQMSYVKSELKKPKVSYREMDVKKGIGSICIQPLKQPTQSAENPGTFKSDKDSEVKNKQHFKQFKRESRIKEILHDLGILIPLVEGKLNSGSGNQFKDGKIEIKTELHSLMDLVRERGEVKVREAAAKLDMDEHLILRFARILEQKNLVVLSHRLMGEPVIIIGSRFLI